MDLSRWAPAITRYADWLTAECEPAARAWSRRLKSKDDRQVEAAVAEVLVWEYIGCRTDSVTIAEVPGEGGVDFAFATGDSRFLVEVTNISVESASDASGMPDTELFRGFYGLLTERIRQKVRRKHKQAAKQSEMPLLVAVTTLHWNASHTCVNRTAVEFAMSSPPKITGHFNPDAGEVEGDLYQSTDLTQSVFLSPAPVLGPDGRPVAQARFEVISGFLLGGFGLCPPDARVFIALNPEARAPFDSSLLPDVPACSFAEWPTSSEIRFEWTISEEEDERRSREAAEARLRAAGLGDLVDEVRREARARNSEQS